MVNLAQQVEHRSVDSKDLVQVQSFTLFILQLLLFIIEII